MGNLFKTIKGLDEIKVDDVLYFLSFNNDTKVWYRNRFDFMIIKGNKRLTIPINMHEYKNEVYGNSRKSSLPGIYPYCQEINSICPVEDSKVLEYIASHLTGLPVKFMTGVSVDKYVDLYDTTSTVYSENSKDETPYTIIGDYVTTFIMVYDATSDKKYISSNDISEYTNTLKWWCDGDIDEFDFDSYYIGDRYYGMAWVESELPSSLLPNMSPIVNMKPSEYLSSMIDELCYINPSMCGEHVNIYKCVEGILTYLILEYPLLYGNNIITNTDELELTDLIERYDGFVIESKSLPSSDDIYREVSDDIYREVYAELFSKDTPPTVFDFYEQFKYLRPHLKGLKMLLEKNSNSGECMIHGKYCNLRSAIMVLRDSLKNFNNIISYIKPDINKMVMYHILKQI